jgi:hypothetical protein
MYILSSYEESQGLSHPPTPDPLRDDVIVSEPVPMVVRWWGGYLYPVLNAAYILHFPDGSKIHQKAGGLIFGMNPGNYWVVYVDLREFTNQILPITTTSRDGWKVTINVNVTWKVNNPLDMSIIKNPVQRLLDQCRTAVTDYIHSTPFNQIVTNPEGQPLADNTITSSILSSLKSNSTLTAYTIIGLTIRDRTGDTRVTEKIQNAYIQQTETAQAQNGEIVRLRRELAVLRQQLLLAEENEKVMVQTARSEVKRDEEKLKYELTKAEVEALSWERLFQVRLEMNFLDQLLKEQQLDHEKFIHYLDILGQAFSDLAKVFSQAQVISGTQQEIDYNQILDYLKQAFWEIMKRYPKK